MDFIDLLKKRRACHDFQPHRQIPKKLIEELVEQTSLTPSGYNAQPWEFVMVTQPERLKKIKEIAFDQAHLEHASGVMVVVGDMEIGRNVDQLLGDWLRLGYCAQEEIPAYRNSIAKKRSPEKRRDMALRNSMLAAMTFIYAAENAGLATCPMMGFSQHELQAYLKIPDDRVVGLMIALGYEDSGKALPRLPRKGVGEVLHWEGFGGSDEENEGEII